MENKFKLIVADIDGTITKSDRTTSKRNIDAIEKLRDTGYIFGLASGRPIDDVSNKYKLWNMRNQFDFIIGWNGCQLYDDKTNKLYEYNLMSENDLKETIEFMDEFDCTINMYSPGIYLSSKETDRAWYSAFKNKREFVVDGNKERYYEKPNGGIMFRTSPDNIPTIEEKLKTLKKKNYVGFKTQPDLIEFCHKDCNKGYALRKYCEIYGISLQNCMAFGDTSNDNEMLKICYGICMKNGSLDTKSCAKIITEVECDEDGFSEFVEKHIL